MYNKNHRKNNSLDELEIRVVRRTFRRGKSEQTSRTNYPTRWVDYIFIPSKVNQKLSLKGFFRFILKITPEHYF